MKLDIKPNCKGSVEITDKERLDEILQDYGEQVVGINISFVAEIYTIPGRIFTSDPADAYPEEYNDERRATSIELALEDGTSLILDIDGDVAEQIELACDAEIYSAEVGE